VYSYYYLVPLLDPNAAACDQTNITPAMPKVAGKRICLCFFKAMPTTGITGASAIGHRLFQYGSRFDDDDDCSGDDDDIEDDIKEDEKERNQQKFVTCGLCVNGVSYDE